MLANKLSSPRLWPSKKHVERSWAALLGTTSCQGCSIMPLACLQGLSWRSFASDNNLGSNSESGSLSADYSELRSYLLKSGRQGSSLGAKARAVELPIGGGLMPEMPRLDTPSARLVSRKESDLMQKARLEAAPGQVGSSITAVIQHYLKLAPRNGMPTGLNAADDLQEVLEKWEELLQQGDADSVAQQMQARPRDVQRIGFAFLKADKKAREAEEKQARRQREEDIKAAFAASRVRTVDHLGRAYATGKRKTSIARVYLKEPPSLRDGLGDIRINGKRMVDYFGGVLTRNFVLKPMEVTDTLGLFDVRVNVKGGGFTGQAQAIRHGLSKALQNWDPKFRPHLKSHGYLTRDPRIVERKKPGRKKARKAFQWVKR